MVALGDIPSNRTRLALAILAAAAYRPASRRKATMRRVARLLRLCPFTAIWTASFLVLILSALLDQRVGLDVVPGVTWLLQILVIPAYVSALAVLLLANQLFGSPDAMPV